MGRGSARLPSYTSTPFSLAHPQAIGSVSVATIARALGRARLQGDRDRTRSRAKVRSETILGKQGDGSPHEWFGLISGHVHTGNHANLVTEKIDRSGHPRQWLARRPACQQFFQNGFVAAGGIDELARFFLWSNTARLREAGDDDLTRRVWGS